MTDFEAFTWTYPLKPKVMVHSTKSLDQVNYFSECSQEKYVFVQLKQILFGLEEIIFFKSTTLGKIFLVDSTKGIVVWDQRWLVWKKFG